MMLVMLRADAGGDGAAVSSALSAAEPGVDRVFPLITARMGGGNQLAFGSSCDFSISEPIYF